MKYAFIICLHNYVVMPNHFHGILEITGIQTVCDKIHMVTNNRATTRATTRVAPTDRHSQINYGNGIIGNTSSDMKNHITGFPIISSITLQNGNPMNSIQTNHETAPNHFPTIGPKSMMLLYGQPLWLPCLR